MLQVGDYVIGNSRANSYGVTRQGWIGKVVSISDNGRYIDAQGVDGHKFDDLAIDRFEKLDAPFNFDDSDIEILCRPSYQWKKAIYNVKCNVFILSDMCSANMHNVISIKNDPRGKYVKCNYCSTIIDNTPEAKAAHANEYKSIEKCLQCNALYRSKLDEKTITTNHITEDKYIVTSETTYQMVCTADFEERSLFEAKESICRYRQCNTFTEMGDAHTIYPRLFDKIATSASLTEDKWTFKDDDEYGYTYKARKRFVLHAMVDKAGIIKCFQLKHEDEWFEIQYSNTHNMLFRWSSYKKDWQPLSGSIPDEKYEVVREFIADIYKET